MEHLDKLGLPISEGDHIVASYGTRGPASGLEIFLVAKVSKKTLALRRVFAKTDYFRKKIHRRYPEDVIKLSEEQVKALLFKTIKESSA